MKKRPEEYLKFYLGCKYKSLKDDIPDGTIVGFSIHPEVGDCCFVDISFIDRADGKEITIPTNCFDEIKPILRPLSDMTEKEAWECWWFVTDPHYSHVTNPKHALSHGNLSISTGEWANITRYLLSKHFDLFGLIESGQAIDIHPKQ